MSSIKKEPSIEFDIRKNKNVGQLVISGPKKSLEEPYEEFKVGSRFPFKLSVSENDDTATWGLNALAIGKLINEESKTEAVSRANDYIGNIVESSAYKPVIQGAGLIVMKYAQQETGSDFDFTAEVERQTLGYAEVEEFMSDSVYGFSEELKLDDGTSADIVTTIEGGRTGVASGFEIAFEDGAKMVRTDVFQHSFEVQAKGLADGTQALVCLFGAVAMANADRLYNGAVKQETL